MTQDRCCWGICTNLRLQPEQLMKASEQAGPVLLCQDTGLSDHQFIIQRKQLHPHH